MTLTTWLLNEDKAGRIDLDMFALISSIATACKQASRLPQLPDWVCLARMCVADCLVPAAAL